MGSRPTQGLRKACSDKLLQAASGALGLWQAWQLRVAAFTVLLTVRPVIRSAVIQGLDTGLLSLGEMNYHPLL